MKPLWEGRRIVTCVGTGGVGKTTASAAIAVAAAAAGRRTLVMTIDPARRLADALGIVTVGNVEHEISPQALAPYGVTLKAPLFAMTPDVKRTFDELVERAATSEDQRRHIFANRIYQHFSTVLAGSHEYAAVEKLYEVYSQKRYDLIVLDTPPSQNVMDFLGAPGRVVDFLENETLQWLVRPYALAGRLSLKLFDLGGSLMLGALQRMAGAETIRDLVEFVLAFHGMYEEFGQRARDVRALLGSGEMAFVLVTSTRPSQQQAAVRFYEELSAEGLSVRALVVNRVRHAPIAPSNRSKARDRLAEILAGLRPNEAAAVAEAIADELALADLDTEASKRLRRRLGDLPAIELPELPVDVHNLETLAHLHRAFWAATGAA